MKIDVELETEDRVGRHQLRPARLFLRGADILLALCRIVHRAGDEIHRQRVHREVAAKQIVLQPAGGDGRQRARFAITLFASGGDVDFRQPVRGDFVGEELRERTNAPVETFRQCACERGAAIFEGDVDVDGVTAEEEIAHRTSHEVRPAFLFGRDFPDEIESTPLRVGEIGEVGHLPRVSAVDARRQPARQQRGDHAGGGPQQEQRRRRVGLSRRVDPGTVDLGFEQGG